MNKHKQERCRLFGWAVAIAVAVSGVAAMASSMWIRSGAAVAVSIAANARTAPVLVLDAGHGGFDGGAVAADGTNEKDINLSVTLKLNALLRAMGFETVLIRSDDVSVETEGASVRERKRSDIRNRFACMEANPGCLYLCIHQNFYSGTSCHGAQIFYTAQNESAKALASALQAAIVADVQPDNTRVIKPCTKDVYLIYHAKETAVLVECGFLSNPDDLSHLKDETDQSKLAFAICDGLLAYLNGRNAL